MKTVFHPEAEEDFNSAVDYYESCMAGLGADFLNEVNASIESALKHPLTWPFCFRHIRRCLVHRFPFGILYSPEPDGIFVLAVMDLHRDPDYWKHRL